MITDIKKILVTEEQLTKKAAELAEKIEKDYNGEDFVAISILKGGFVQKHKKQSPDGFYGGVKLWCINNLFRKT